MKVLCMCQGGNSRSVGMACLLKLKYRIDAIACGWEFNSTDTKNMLFKWADIILVMQECMRVHVPEEFQDKILVTDVGEDQYFRIDSGLLNLCDSLIQPYLRQVDVVESA